jgi:nucleoside-diphosphate-sugar epimerase
VVVFRSTHIIGPPEASGPTADAFRARGDRPVLVPGDGSQRVAPVFLEDVVSALMAGLVRGQPGTYELAGPETMTLDELVSLLNGGLARVRHVPARVARLAARFLPSLPRAAVDLMLRDSLGDPSRAVEAFGLSLHSLRDVWSWQWI